METRPLGNSGIDVTTIATGLWAMGGGPWGEVDDDESVAALVKSYEVGIRFFDAAAVYGFRRAEGVLGRALKDMNRDEVIVATKTGVMWDDKGNRAHNSSPGFINQQLDESLAILGVDYIDLYQLHIADYNTPFETSWAAMQELVKAGKVRAVGVSNYRVEDIQRCLSVGPVHSLQPQYSLLRRDIEKDLLPFCRENNIAVIAYSPMHHGLLTGKFTRDTVIPEGDFRRDAADFQGDRLEANLRVIERLRPIAGAHGKTLANLAVRWVLGQPGVTSALVGAKTPEQVEENAKADGWRLSEDELCEIDRILVEERV